MQFLQAGIHGAHAEAGGGSPISSGSAAAAALCIETRCSLRRFTRKITGKSFASEESVRMNIKRWFWGQSSTGGVLLALSAIVVFANLGASELWTQEGRWAAICTHMLESGDYLHPYLFGEPYYDKPLISYWLMIGAARLVGSLNETAMRLPSALAGVVSIWCTYRLGTTRFDRATGLVAGFVLATCYMFVFWARVASADMLNVLGTIGAVTWYFERKEHPGFVTSAVLFGILAIAALMKGLIAPVIAGLVLLPDLAHDGQWRRMLRPSIIPAALLALAIYLVPFVGSSLTRPAEYSESGLQMVFHENAVRYLNSFDHEEPFYIYLGSLPLYLLPWSVLLPFVLRDFQKRWGTMSHAARWPAWSSLLVLIFLTLSGSRRSYYILPILPFAALVIAQWLRLHEVRQKWDDRSAWIAAGMFVALFIWFGIVVPTGFRYGGERLLARQVRVHAEEKAPWPSWHILICGAPPAAGYYFRTGIEARVIPAEQAATVGAVVAGEPHTIVITKQRFVDAVRSQLPSATVFAEPSRIPRFLRFLRAPQESDRQVMALVP